MPEITRWGETFGIAEDVGAMALIEFAQVANQGADANDLEGLAAIGNLIDELLHPDDLQRFKKAARKARAKGDELLEVVFDLMRHLTDRPTQQPSDSSDGLQNTSESSAGGSSSPVVSRLEAQGRPDLALVVDQAEASRLSA